MRTSCSAKLHAPESLFGRASARSSGCPPRGPKRRSGSAHRRREAASPEPRAPGQHSTRRTRSTSGRTSSSWPGFTVHVVEVYGLATAKRRPSRTCLQRAPAAESPDPHDDHAPHRREAGNGKWRSATDHQRTRSMAPENHAPPRGLELRRAAGLHIRDAGAPRGARSSPKPLPMKSPFATLGAETTNGDGRNRLVRRRGHPGVFHSVEPAWHDRNLRELAAHMISPLVFAHIRASSGSPVQQTNPPVRSAWQWLWMHNGVIHEFLRFKRDSGSPSIRRCTRKDRRVDGLETFFYLALTMGLEDPAESRPGCGGPDRGD